MDTSKSFPLSKQDDWFPYHIEWDMARNLFKFSYQIIKKRKSSKKKAAGIGTNIEVLILQYCERSLPYAGKE